MAHVVADFALEWHPEFRDWHQDSQYIVALQTPSPEALEALRAQAKVDGLFYSCFHEPDRGGELTALAFVPSDTVAQYLKALPLAGRHYKKITETKGAHS